MNEWMNEWINEWVNKWLNELLCLDAEKSRALEASVAILQKKQKDLKEGKWQFFCHESVSVEKKR